MTVAALIEALLKLPPDLPVFYVDTDYGQTAIDEADEMPTVPGHGGYVWLHE